MVGEHGGDNVGQNCHNPEWKHTSESVTEVTDLSHQLFIESEVTDLLQKSLSCHINCSWSD